MLKTNNLISGIQSLKMQERKELDGFRINYLKIEKKEVLILHRKE
jgi:hypothetical protein